MNYKERRTEESVTVEKNGDHFSITFSDGRILNVSKAWLDSKFDVNDHIEEIRKLAEEKKNGNSPSTVTLDEETK